MRKFMGCIVICFPTWGAAEEVVIAALGDSLTQGFGLMQEQGFVPQLQNCELRIISVLRDCRLLSVLTQSQTKKVVFVYAALKKK